MPDDPIRDFRAHVLSRAFPCIGGQAAVRSGQCVTRAYDGLTSKPALSSLADDLLSFMHSYGQSRTLYAVFAAIDSSAERMAENDFEHYVWSVLNALSALDKCTWDSKYSQDSEDPHFKFSFGGHAIFVIGMHPKASRLARQTQHPTLVFNPVWQFEVLREENRLDRMISVVRERDASLQGSINPNLGLEGIRSDALQYSGKEVSEDWRCPYRRPTT